MLAFVLIGLVWLVAGLLALIVYEAIHTGKERPPWRRLPSRPGLPPEMEYQTWTVIDGFNPHELSDAVVDAIRALASPTGPFGLATVYGSLRGARLLVYTTGTYLGSECDEAVGVGSADKTLAIERDFNGVAHAIAHLVERRAGNTDSSHDAWAARGITNALATYAINRQRGHR